MWNESHTNCFDSFLFTLRTIVESVCLLYIWRERNSFSRMSWYFRCYPGSCFVFFLSFFSLSFILAIYNGVCVLERTSRCCTCVMGRPSTVNFFFSRKQHWKKKEKILLTSFVCVSGPPLQSAPGVTSSTLSNGADHPPSPPPPRFWSLLVRGITQTRATVLCMMIISLASRRITI